MSNSCNGALSGRSCSGKNIDNPVKKIRHQDLARSGDSPYKSQCPECFQGLLLVRRNRETLQLESLDNCILCGQMFEYTDIEELRKNHG